METIVKREPKHLRAVRPAETPHKFLGALLDTEKVFSAHVELFGVFTLHHAPAISVADRALSWWRLHAVFTNEHHAIEYAEKFHPETGWVGVNRHGDMGDYTCVALREGTHVYETDLRT